MSASLVGSEMCIRDRARAVLRRIDPKMADAATPRTPSPAAAAGPPCRPHGAPEIATCLPDSSGRLPL
eukprot:11401323-Alexandrium_andersonii.AAC.1